jgi:hypothetical protein
MIHPKQGDFEERIIYDEGDYLYKPDDIEARNLIAYLHLNNDTLSRERKNALKRLKDLLAALDNDMEKFIPYLKEFQATPVSFPRMIKEEFGIDL